ncbi:MAG: hypothetical protein ABEJ80_06125 [Halarchaeum sp.]
MFGRPALVVAFACVLALAPASAAAAAGGPGGGHGAAASATPCFPAAGHSFTIGTGDATIDAVVHTSLFERLLTSGSVGAETAGRLGNATIVDLRFAVVFAGVGDVGTFVSDPLSRFALAFRYRFSLPMLAAATGDDYEYARDDPDVGGVGDAACAWTD